MDSKTQPAPDFRVRDIPVYGDLILAPMDGYSDFPFRSLTRVLGSALSYTEYINAMDVLNKHPRLHHRLQFSEAERPVVFQIYDNEPQRLLQAALRLREFNPDIFDVNMGCPAKTVSRRGAGVGLMQTPEKIEEIFKLLTKHLDIPITGKIRLGWDAGSRNYLQVAHIIEDNGGQLLAVHGRTKEQGYTGKADWDAIAEVKQALSIPVIGNGDVNTVEDIDEIKRHTGCDGVMIGRAAMYNPWIFQRLNREQISNAELHRLMHIHLDLMLEYYGPELGIKLFRKNAVRYLKVMDLEREQRANLLSCVRPEEFIGLLQQLFPQIAT
jgi:tRNA-dihydrouridine synthase B